MNTLNSLSKKFGAKQATNPSRATLALHRLIDAPAAMLSRHADDEQGAAKTLLANGELWKGANQ
jgi:hypothetical protein